MSSKSIKGTLFKALYWLVFLLFIWLIYRNIEDYSALVETFQRANWITLGYVFLIAVGNLLMYALMYESNFRALSEVKNFPGYFQEVLISYFLSMTTPLGTTGGNAYLITYLRSVGFSSLRAFFAIISTSISSMTIFTALLVVALRYLSIQHQLNGYQIAATFALLVYTSIFGTVMVTVLILPSFSIRFARIIARIMNWFPDRFLDLRLIEEKKIKKYTDEVINMSANFDQSILKFVGTLKYAAAYHFFNIVTLFLAFQAYGTEISISALLMVYCILILFSIMSPTPQGIGLAEGLAHLAAVSVGVPGSDALIVILTYRIVTIWMPALIGFLLFRVKMGKKSTSQ